MLNRRSLRIKAMQSLFALQQSFESNYELGFEEIDAFFAPDLNSMEVQDHQFLKSEATAAKELFTQFYKSPKVTYTSQSERVIKAVEDARKNAFARNKKDINTFRTAMLEDITSIQREYVAGLYMMIALADQLMLEEEENQKKFIKPLPTPLNKLKFFKNSIVEKLRKNALLEKEKLRLKVSFDDSNLKKIYREQIKQDATYIAYTELEKATVEEDRSIVLHIFKQIILKNEIAQSYFEDNDLDWVENKDIVRSLVAKSLKAVDPATDAPEPILEVSGNWEEDAAYFKDLYNLTVEHDEELQQLIDPKLQNWDSERVATTDMIILKMAVCEMLYFPSIPVKVTINEFIELSKEYSTPKSKLFVNGLLDNLSAELTKSGKIKKSGRGLLDNK